MATRLSPWTEALLKVLGTSGEYRWYDVDSVFKRIGHTVPEDRALKQYANLYRQQKVKPPRDVMVEKGRRLVLHGALFQLVRTNVATVDPPLSLGTRGQKRRMKLVAPRPGSRSTPWVQVMYAELEGGEWHDMQALIRKMARTVPPHRAASNYRTNYKTQHTGAQPGRVKATTLQQQVRDGAWDLCRRAIVSAAQRGRVEIQGEGKSVIGKKVRWVGYEKAGDDAG